MPSKARSSAERLKKSRGNSRTLGLQSSGYLASVVRHKPNSDNYR
jgi:hypothetical protein